MKCWGLLGEGGGGDSPPKPVVLGRRWQGGWSDSATAWASAVRAQGQDALGWGGYHCCGLDVGPGVVGGVCWHSRGVLGQRGVRCQFSGWWWGRLVSQQAATSQLAAGLYSEWKGLVALAHLIARPQLSLNLSIVVSPTVCSTQGDAPKGL
jgi:hypothetical protein